MVSVINLRRIFERRVFVISGPNDRPVQVRPVQVMGPEVIRKSVIPASGHVIHGQNLPLNQLLSATRRHVLVMTGYVRLDVVTILNFVFGCERAGPLGASRCQEMGFLPAT